MADRPNDWPFVSEDTVSEVASEQGIGPAQGLFAEISFRRAETVYLAGNRHPAQAYGDRLPDDTGIDCLMKRVASEPKPLAVAALLALRMFKDDPQQRSRIEKIIDE